MKCPFCSGNINIQFIKAPPDAQQSAPTRNGSSVSGLGALLDSIDEGELDSKAADFVSKTRERFQQYGNRTRMSEPQMKWLEDIAGGSNRKDSWD